MNNLYIEKLLMKISFYLQRSQVVRILMQQVEKLLGTQELFNIEFDYFDKNIQKI